MAHSHDKEASSKEASGLLVYLVEELGDARLRCLQLKKYVDEATSLVSKSTHRDHFFEVAGHLIHGIPESLFKLEKALEATALAASRLDYEEIKQDLKPEKAEELEQAMKDVRIRYVQRRSGESMKPRQASQELKTIAAKLKESKDQSGAIESLMTLLASVESGMAVTASEDKMAVQLEVLAKELDASKELPKRDRFASVLRQVIATYLVVAKDDPLSSYIAELQGGAVVANSRQDVMDGFMKANPSMSKEDAEKAADMWEKNKNVVKDKSAAMDQQALSAIGNSREEVMDGFKKQNPDLTQEQLEEFADNWEKNKDVVKDKQAAEMDDAAFGRLVGLMVRNSQAILNQVGRFGGVNSALRSGHGDTLAGQFHEIDQAMRVLRRRLEPAVKFASDPMKTALETAVDATDACLSALKKADPPPGVISDVTKAYRLLAGCLDQVAHGKTASWKAESEDKEAKFEEGKPADPTENMSPEDAKKWKEEHDKNKDRFKSAARTTHLAGKKGFTLCGERAYPDTIVDSVKDTTCHYCEQAWKKSHGGHTASNPWKVEAAAPKWDKAKVKSWMQSHVKDHVDNKTDEVNTTSLAEEAASQFDIYEDKKDYSIPEELFDMAVIVGEAHEKKIKKASEMSPQEKVKELKEEYKRLGRLLADELMPESDWEAIRKLRDKVQEEITSLSKKTATVHNWKA